MNVGGYLTTFVTGAGVTSR